MKYLLWKNTTWYPLVSVSEWHVLLQIKQVCSATVSVPAVAAVVTTGLYTEGYAIFKDNAEEGCVECEP